MKIKRKLVVFLAVLCMIVSNLACTTAMATEVPEPTTKLV